jgi:NADH-quinone oxidoreductase subunit M
VTAEKAGARRRFGDLSRREIAVLAPLVALILVLGIYPKPVLDVLTPSVGATLSDVGVADPVTAQGGK